MRGFGLALLVTALALGSLAALRANGEGLTVTPIVAARGVAADATADNGQRKLARGDDGRLYLAYTRPVEGVEQAQVSFSLDDGQSWKPEVTLARPGIWSDLATLAAGPNGRLDAAWVDYATDGTVWYASREEGSWSEFAKISPGETYAGYPAMVIRDDVANVLWYAAPPAEDRAHGSAYEIMHSFRQDGQWSQPRLLSSNSEDALNPALASGPDDVLYGSWFENFLGAYSAQVAVYDGINWSFPTLISTPAETATGVSIDSGTDGVVHLVWEQANEDQFGVAYARLDDGVWSQPEMLSNVVSQDPVVATDGDHRVLVLWSEDGALEGRVWDGRWSETSDLGPGTNPTTLSGDRVLGAWTRETAAGSEVVTAYLRITTVSPAMTVGLWAAAAVMLATGLVLFWRGRPLSGGHTADGED